MGNPYETNKLVSEYLLFHYGSPAEILPFNEGPKESLDFAVRSVTEMLDLPSIPPDACALDLGCAVGRATFTLSRYCQTVLGIDFSHAFVEAAQTMAIQGELPFDRIDEGTLATRLIARLPSNVHAERTTFQQGDAMALSPDLGPFDVCLLANLICRLPQPQRCLERLPDIVKPGGQLIIASPYTWLDDFTPREAWLGGFLDGSRPIITIEALTEALEPAFVLEKRTDLPMLIREHSRKYQWTVSEGTRWRRRLK